MLVMMSRSIYQPITRITKTAKKYAKGDFTAQIDVHSNDEIGYLANTLNYMATELDTLEEDQRKFVSNVSHDFRPSYLDKGLRGGHAGRNHSC